MKLFVLFTFLITYFLIIKFRPKALWIIYGAVFVFISTRAITPAEAIKSIDFNVLGVFLGTMMLSSLFIMSGVPAYLTDLILDRSKKTSTAFLLICGLSAFISSFTENIATVLIVAPLALEVAKKLKLNPSLLLIGISISSNLQGTATLIGDAPSIILATETGMTFNDFFWMFGKPSIFFAVQFGAVPSFFVLYLFYKKYNQALPRNLKDVKVKSWVPAILMSLMVLNLVVFSILRFRSAYVLAAVCMGWGIAGLLWQWVFRSENFSVTKDIDWYSIFFLAGIFILVGTLTYSGIIDEFADWLIAVSGGSVLESFIIIITMSVLVSAFVDNIPYIIAMIPLTIKMAASMDVSIFLFLFALLIGTCLGGNITPIGSASNVVTMGILRKNGIPVKMGEFVKLGLPFTIAAVLFASLFVWLVWR
ncbi:MAG: TRAP transporter large permease subunit [Endomicrobiales bacterium]|nr:TRAP transporter large permease subunit [Endomicrobiales bacterium]